MNSNLETASFLKSEKHRRDLAYLTFIAFILLLYLACENFGYFYNTLNLKYKSIFFTLSFSFCVIAYLFLCAFYKFATNPTKSHRLCKTQPKLKVECSEIAKPDIQKESTNVNEELKSDLLFENFLANKIHQIITDLKLSSHNDLILLFSFIQHFIIENNVSNVKLIKQIDIELNIKMPSASYYGQITNKLYEWKEDSAKIKSYKSTYNKSAYYDRFVEIKTKFESF